MHERQFCRQTQQVVATEVGLLLGARAGSGTRMAALLQSRDSGQQGLALKRAGDCLEEACKRQRAAPELSQHSSYDSITSEDFALGGAWGRQALSLLLF
jgi:hypothetical protein